MRRIPRKLRALFGAARRGERIPLNPRLQLVIKIAVLLPSLGVLTLLGFVGVSNTPRFCTSCHYMQPFYDAWKKSSHNNVACVECHIPPGAKNWVQHKFAATVQLVKYVTRQYGTKPWTEVSDASCLRRGCHETRLLSGKVDFGGVTFDHGPHLTSFRRVTRLRCTSCHAQIVQGTHISVTSSSCFLCHFKNTYEEPEMARCQLCHREIKPHRRIDIKSEAWVKELPEVEPPRTPKYDHKEVLARAVDCRECHSDVVRGNGEVPRDRCLTCHVEPERLGRYSDTQFMHRKHVTDHKVDCQRCHTDIVHQLPPKDQTPQLNCATCHPGQHQATRDLYRGEGGHDAAPKANPMFDVRVPCEGCHKTHQAVDGQRITTRASAAGCMLCHGESFGRDLARWQADAATWTNWSQQALARTEKELAAVPQDLVGATVKGSLRRAADNVRLVVTGHFVHNPDYAIELLRAARRDAEAALQAVHAAYRWPKEPPRRTVPRAEGKCDSCHPNIVAQRGHVFGVEFDHGRHVGRQSLPCGTCHSAATKPEAPGHGRLVISRDGCRTCHEQRGQPSPHEPGWKILHSGQARLNRETCATCHSTGFCDRCHGTRIPHQADWVRQHGTQGKRSQVCAKCHQTTFCQACHRAAPPHDHDRSWPRSHGQSAKRTPERCNFCHQDKTFCNSCHGVQVPHAAEFKRGGHGTTAAQQPELCARCHEASDCAVCHRSSPPKNHTAKDWGQTHGATGQRNAGLCALCHGSSSCSDCHGLTMPHPDDWAIAAHGPVAKGDRQVCARCHETTFCAKCHVEGAGTKP